MQTCFSFQDSERLSPAARLHLFGPNKKASLLTLPGKYCQASSCKGFRLSCQFKPRHKKIFVLTSMMCIWCVQSWPSVSLKTKKVFQGSYLLMRAIEVQSSYWEWLSDRLRSGKWTKAWTNLFISLRSIYKTHLTCIWKAYLKKHFSQHVLEISRCLEMYFQRLKHS